MAVFIKKGSYRLLTPIWLVFLLVLSGCGGSLDSTTKKDTENGGEDGGGETPTTTLPSTPTVNDVNILENQIATLVGTCRVSANTTYETNIIDVTIDSKSKTTACVNDSWGVEFPSDSFSSGRYTITVLAKNNDGTESLPGFGNISVSDGTGPVVQPGPDAPEKPTIDKKEILASQNALLTGSCTKNQDSPNKTDYVIVSVKAAGSNASDFKTAPCKLSSDGNADTWSADMGTYSEGVYVISVVAVNNNGIQSDQSVSNLEVSSTTVNMVTQIENSSIEAGAKTLITISFEDQRSNPLSGSASLTFSSRCIVAGTAVMLDLNDEVQNEFESTGASLRVKYQANGCVGEDNLSINGTFNGVSVAVVSPIEITVAKDRVTDIESLGSVPAQISAQGSNGNHISEVTFKLIGTAGAIVPGQKVTFNLEGKSGDLSLIDETPDTPNEISDISDTQGRVSVRVRSGFTPGNVTVLATYTDSVTGNIVIGRSDGLSVARGLTSYGNFNLSIDRYSPLSYDRGPTQADPLKIVAIVHDRYGRPVVDGTLVTFQVESTTPLNPSGAIGFFDVPDCLTEKGICSVNWLPNKNNNAPDSYVTVLAIAKGEENFIDKNSNGFFDDGDELLDLAEGYLDHLAYWDYVNGDAELVSSNYVDDNYWLIDSDNDGIRDLENGKFDGINCKHSSLCSETKIVDIIAQITFHQSSSDIDMCKDFDQVDSLHVYANEILSLTGLVYCDHFSKQQIPTGAEIKFEADGGEIVYGESYKIIGDQKLPKSLNVNFKAGSVVTNSATVTAKIIVPRENTDGDGDVTTTMKQWKINIQVPIAFSPPQPKFDTSQIYVARGDKTTVISGTCEPEVIFDLKEDGYDEDQGDYTVVTDEVRVEIDGQFKIERDCDGTWSLPLEKDDAITLSSGEKDISVVLLSQPHGNLPVPDLRYESAPAKGKLFVANTPDEAIVNNASDYQIISGEVYLKGTCTNDNTTHVKVVATGPSSGNIEVVCSNTGLWQAEIGLTIGDYLVSTEAINKDEKSKFSDASLYTTPSSFPTSVVIIN